MGAGWAGQVADGSRAGLATEDVELIGGEGTEGLFVAIGPAHRDTIDLGNLSEPTVDAGIVAGPVAFVRSHGSPPGLARRFDLDLGANGIASLGIEDAEIDPVTAVSDVVPKDVKGSIAIDDDDVD